MNKLALLGAAAALVTLTACGTSTPKQPPISDVNRGTGYPAGSVQEFQNIVGDRVLFAYDQYILDQHARSILQAQSQWLTRYSQYSTVIEGHADERGTREYNLALGERRAHSVREFLISQGVSPNRIRVVSYGKERPVCAEATESCFAQNRRAVTALQ